MKYNKFFLALLATLLVSIPLQAQYGTAKVDREFDIQGDNEFYLELDIDAGEVIVKRNSESHKLAVYMRYTESEFEYDLDYSEKNRTLRLTFDKKGWVDGDDRDTNAEIEVFLPTHVILDIRSKIKAGKIEMRVGGISLRHFNLKTWAGEVLVDFDQPNRITMNSFDVNIKVGETQLRNLGNAHFRSADIDNGIGALDIDFSGDLPSDASARIDLDIGETAIFIPDEMGVKLSVRKFLFLSQVNISRELRKSGSYYFSDNYNSKEKSLDLEVRPGIGELNVRYR